MNGRGRAPAAASLVLVTFIGACGGGGEGQPVDPLTAQLAGMCGLNAQKLSYWGRGLMGFGLKPRDYIWQTTDAQHSVTVTSLVLRSGGRMSGAVSCDERNPSGRINISTNDLPTPTPVIPSGAG